MRQAPDLDALDRWLAAEQLAAVAAERSVDHGHEALAEAAFAELLSALPPPAPPAGFASSVLARLDRWAPGATDAVAGSAAATARGARGALRPRREWAAWRWLLVAPILIPAGWLLWWLPTLVRGAARIWSFADLVQAVLRLIVQVVVSLAPALLLGHKLVRFAAAVGTTLMTPGIALMVAGCLLVAALAFRSLQAVVSSHRRWVYADPI